VSSFSLLLLWTLEDLNHPPPPGVRVTPMSRYIFGIANSAAILTFTFGVWTFGWFVP